MKFRLKPKYGKKQPNQDNSFIRFFWQENSHCVKNQNFGEFPGVKILGERTETLRRLCLSTTRKLGVISIFYGVSDPCRTDCLQVLSRIPVSKILEYCWKTSATFSKAGSSLIRKELYHRVWKTLQKKFQSCILLQFAVFKMFIRL